MLAAPSNMRRPIGFYWTEGRFGHGLTSDAVPPLNAGSVLCILSPPAVMMSSGRVDYPDDRGRGRYSGISETLDIVVAEQGRKALSMAARRKCRVRPCCGVDWVQTVQPAHLLRRGRLATRSLEALADCWLEYGQR